MLIDSHCHIHHLGLQEDELLNSIARARQVGVEKIINVAISLEEVAKLRTLSDRHPSIYHSVGLHPHDINKSYVINKERIIQLSNYPNCVAIGETGLDFSLNSNVQARDLQVKNFIMHIEAALETNKPLIIHSRNAEQECVNLIKKYSGLKGVFHCFTGNLYVAQQVVDLGFYVSFSGIVTFKNASVVREAASQLPLDSILIETDAPYLTPTPFRGKFPNLPEHVIFVAQEIARLRQDDYKNIAQYTRNNTIDLFNL